MTYALGKTSRSRLATCHLDIVRVIELAITMTKHDFFVAEGYRDKEAQDKAYATGASKVKFPTSYHNVTPYSLAVDIVPYASGKAVWACDTDEEKAAWEAVVKSVNDAAKHLNVPLDWGFDLWGWDRPHWQLTGYR